MTNKVGISVSADLSSLKSELQGAVTDAKQAGSEIQKALAGGKLSIDTTSVTAAMKRLDDEISKKRKLGVDTSDAEKVAASVRSVVSSMGGAQPGPSQSAKRTKDIEKERQALKRLADDYKRVLGKEITEHQARAVQSAMRTMNKSGGAQSAFTKPFGTDFSGWLSGHAAMFSDPKDAARHREHVLKYVQQRAGIGGGQTGGWHMRGGRYGAIAGAAGGALGAMATGGGDGGMFSAIGRGAGGMVGAGAGMMIGGPVGAAVGYMAGSFLGAAGGGVGARVDQGVQTAQTNAIETSKLRYSMGALNNDFNSLEGIVRAAADSMHMLDSEVIGMARSFARGSGVGNGSAVMGDVATAGRYSRATGAEAGSTNSFFATMRLFGGTGSNDSSSRRMGYLIGEAIAKSGAFAKADEMMAAVSSFATNSGRSSLMSQAGSVEGYAGMLATMAGGKLKDVAGFGSMLSQADASFRSGGGGDASWNFRLGAYKNGYSQNIHGHDTQLINEQGLWGSASDVYRKGSKYYDAADDKTRQRYDAAYSDMQSRGTVGKRNIDVTMEAMNREFPDSNLRQDAIAKEMFGGNRSHAIAFEKAWKGGGSAGIGRQLRSIVGRDVSPDQVMAASPFLNAEQGDLTAQAKVLKDGRGFRNKLSAEESASLDTKDIGALREAVVKLTATRQWEKDKGREVEDGIKGVANAIDRFSDKLIPISTGIRDAVLMMIKSDPTSLLAQQEKWAMKPHDDERKSAIKSAVEQRQARHNAIVANLPRSERMAALKATQEDYEQQIADANSGYDTKVGEYRKSRDAAAAKANGTTDPVSEDMQSQHQAVLDGDSRGTIPGIGPRFSTSVKPDEIKAKVRAAAERHGVPAEVALGVADYESGFKNFNGKLVTDKKSAHYGDRALGPMQLMDKTAKGLGVDRQDLDGNIDGGTKYLAQLYKQTGSWDEARRRYLGLGKKGDGNGTTADKYLEETKKRAEKYSGDAKLSRLDSAPSLAATDATPKKSATAISAPTDKLPENVAPPVDSPLSKVSYQDKVPSGMGGGSGTFGFDPMRFEGVFQLQDHSGRQIAEPILRTGVSAPRLVSA